MLIALAINALYLHQVLAGGKQLRPFFYDSDVNQHTGCDFFALYVAGQGLSHGGDIYHKTSSPTDAIGQAIDAVLHPGGAVPCYYNFRYLPVAAALGVPFAQFSPAQARLAWVIFIELLALICALATLRLIPGIAGALLAACWLAASPVYLELYMGQFNMLQAALLLGALVYAGREKPPYGAFALGGALLWKMTAWVAAPALLFKHKWRTLVFSALIAGLTTLAYWLWTGISLAPFVHNFLPEEVITGVYRGDLGLLMLLRHVIGNMLTDHMVVVVPAVVIALTLIVNYVKRKAPLGDHLALWLVAFFFIYPTIWEHHYLMLLPPLIYLYQRTRSPLLWVAALLLALPTPYYWAGPHGHNWAGIWPLLYHGAKPLSALLVYATAVFARR